MQIEKDDTLGKARTVLLKNSNGIAKVESFEDLFGLVHHLLSPISGVGELYIYDTTLRIGVKMGFLPQKVYLHAGTRFGAKNLGPDYNGVSLEVASVPREFQELSAHEIEDVLCIYKEHLNRATRTVRSSDAVGRSWCN